jgi:hypothetical protein
MTIILPTLRESFAILAADSLHGGARIAYASKIVLHKYLPLAFAAAGSSWLEIAGLGASTTNHLHSFSAQITSPAELNLSDIADRVQRRFLPGVENIRLATQIYVALVREGRAEIGVQLMQPGDAAGDRTKFYRCTVADSRPLIPPAITDFCRAQLPTMHDRAIQDVQTVAAKTREVMNDCVAYERNSISGGTNKIIGGTIDIAAVTAAGAHFIF